MDHRRYLNERLDIMSLAMEADDFHTFEDCLKEVEDIEEEIVNGKSRPELDWLHDLLFYKEGRLIDLVRKAEDLNMRRYVLYLIDSLLGDILVHMLE